MKSLVVIALLWFANLSYSQSFHLSIELTGFEGGTSYLFGVLGDQNYVIDSSKVDKNKSIVFKREKALEGGMYFVLLPDQQIVQVLVDKEQDIVLTSDYKNLVGSMKVAGSLDNTLLYDNLQFEQTYTKSFNDLKQQIEAPGVSPALKSKLELKRDSLIKARLKLIHQVAQENSNTLYAKFKTAGQNPIIKYPKDAQGNLDQLKQVFYYRNEFWNDVDFQDDRLVRTPVIRTKLDRYLSQLVDQNVDSLIKYTDLIIKQSIGSKEMFKFLVNYIGLKYKTPKFMGGDMVYAHIIRNYVTPEHAFWATEYEIKYVQTDADIRYSSQIGNSAKDFTVTKSSGETMSLLSLKSKFIVLFIYSTECEHCQEAAPKLVNNLATLKSNGAEVMALCNDQSKAQWLKFIAANKMAGIHNTIDVGNKSKYEFKYHVDITPEIYLIDENRKIVAKDLSVEQLLEFIKKLEQ